MAPFLNPSCLAWKPTWCWMCLKEPYSTMLKHITSMLWGLHHFIAPAYKRFQSPLSYLVSHLKFCWWAELDEHIHIWTERQQNTTTRPGHAELTHSTRFSTTPALTSEISISMGHVCIIWSWYSLELLLKHQVYVHLPEIQRLILARLRSVHWISLFFLSNTLL